MASRGAGGVGGSSRCLTTRKPPRLTLTGALILSLGVILVSYGSYTLSPLPMIAGFTLVMLVAISYGIAHLASLAASSARLEARAEPTAVTEGGCVQVCYELEAGPGAILAAVGGARLGSGRVCKRIRVKYGRLRFRSLELRAGDPLGIFEVRVVRRVDLVVYGLPAYARLVSRLAGSSAWMYGGSSGRPGTGTTYLYSREYAPDDDARLIDWKASARLARLLVKVFEAEALANIMLVLDATPTLVSRWGSRPARLLASIAYAALSAGNRVYVATVSDKVYTSGWIEGVHSMPRVLRILAEVEQETLIRDPSIRAALLSRLARAAVNPPVLVILATDFTLKPGVYTRSLAALASRGRLVVAGGVAARIPGVEYIGAYVFEKPEALVRLVEQWRL